MKKTLYTITGIVLAVLSSHAQVIDLNQPSANTGSYTATNVDTLSGISQPYMTPVEVVTHTSQAEVNDVSPLTTGTKEEVATSSPTNSPSRQLRSTSTVSIDKSKIYGEIPISENVSPTGARTYSVPIWIADGSPRSQPQLSINYNSQGGDNTLGMGWGLGGFSSITRAHKVPFYDNTTRHFDETYRDAFVLDGMRLMNPVFNAANNTATYTAEQPNIKVKAFLKQETVSSQSKYTIKYFEVDYPNGTQITFGFYKNERALPSYPISKIKDQHGAVIDFHYYVENNDVYSPKAIYYGKKASLPHFASVSFDYISRSHSRFNYVKGRKIQQDKLLTKITCKSGSTTLYEYALNYDNSEVPLMNRIDCKVNGASLNPLRFTYGVGNVAKLEKHTTLLTEYYTGSQTALRRGKFTSWSGDDGLLVFPSKATYAYWDFNFYNYHHKDEQVLIYAGLNSSMSVPHKISKETGFIDVLVANVDGTLNDEVIKINNPYYRGRGSGIVSFSVYQRKSTAIASAIEKKKQVGFDLEDYMSHKPNFYTNTYYFVNPKFYHTGDFDGDGKAEVLGISASNPINKGIPSRVFLFDLDQGKLLFRKDNPFHYKVDFSDYSKNDIILTIDYDGDGKTDICKINDSGIEFFTFDVTLSSSGNTYTLRKVSSNTSITKPMFKDKKLLLGEFNGDGKVDFLISPTQSYRVEHRKPQVGYRCLFCHRPYCEDDPHYRLIHESLITGDESVPCMFCSKRSGYGVVCQTHGRVDAMFGFGGHPECLQCKEEWKPYTDYKKGDLWTHAYSKGNGSFEVAQSKITECWRANDHVLQDVNGDGYSDLVIRNGLEDKVYVHLCNGNTINSQKEPVNISLGSSQLIPCDVGSFSHHSSQVLGVHNSTLSLLAYTKNKTEDHLLTTVINSKGLVSKTEYHQMKEDEHGVYLKGYQAQFPYADFDAPIYLSSNTKLYSGNTLIANKGYRYSEAVIHRQGLGMCGFKQVSTTDYIDASQSVTRTYDPMRNGLLTVEESSTQKKSFTYHFSRDAAKVLKSWVTQITAYDKLNRVTTSSQYQYNTTYGYPVKETVRYGSSLTQTTSFDYYNVNNGSYYLIGVPKSKVVTLSNAQGSVTTKDVWNYNSQWRVSSELQYINNNKSSETQFVYNTWGGVTEKKNRLFGATDFLSEKYTYTQDARFLASITNPLGQKTSYTYNTIRGLLTEETDFKGNKTRHTYDALNRKIQTVDATGVTTAVTYAWGSGNFTSEITKTSTNTPTKKEYADALGRKLRESVVSFDGSPLLVDYQYDSKGRLHKVSEPYKQGTTQRWTSTSFDSYSRPSRIVSPSGATQTISYGSQSVTKSFEGQTKTEYFDAAGRLIKVADDGGTILHTLRPDGQPQKTTAPGNSVTSFEYDAWGRRTKIMDPSAGTISTFYNAKGELEKQIDARGKETRWRYDRYGRMITETNEEFSTDYAYNTDGLLASVRSSNNPSKTYTYDKLLRLVKKQEVVDGRSYSEQYTYSQGRLIQVDYAPIGYNVKYHYNSHKHLFQLSSATTGGVLWTKQAEDSKGNITKELLGNGVQVNHTFSVNGLPTGTKATKGTQVLHHWLFDFDQKKGNLMGRTNKKYNQVEAFTYDKLNRLTTGLTYDTKGNILSKQGVGNYEYNLSSRPYALTSVENTTGVIPSLEQTVSYTSFSRPLQIKEGDRQINFSYNGDKDRVKSVLKVGTQSTTNYYFGEGQYQHITEGGTTKELLFIGGSPYSAPLVVEKKAGKLKHYYIHRDYLGSVLSLTNDQGLLAVEYSYDPWGRMRNPKTNQLYAVGSEPPLFIGRGYTGHEHLQAFGVINMNARLYDPVIGRFFSPDPYVQAPDFTQNYNRYGYCLNNPLVYTDPDGELAFLAIVAIGAAVFGTTNLAIQAANGEIDNFWDGAKAFGAGAIAGAAITAGVTAGLGVPVLGTVIKGARILYGGTTALSAVTGLGKGVFKGGWSKLKNTGKIFIGNFYLDSNRNFFAQTWQGISRHTWELPQSTIGHGYSQLRNTFWSVRVDYFGGATFVTNENRDDRSGMSLGNFINISIRDEIQGDFDARVISDPLFMHEYGHSFDSRLFGLSYLFAIGLPSLISASRSSPVNGEPPGVTTHDFRWYEMRANRHGARYFKKYYGVNWDLFETENPRRKR